MVSNACVAAHVAATGTMSAMSAATPARCRKRSGKRHDQGGEEKICTCLTEAAHESLATHPGQLSLQIIGALELIAIGPAADVASFVNARLSKILLKLYV